MNSDFQKSRFSEVWRVWHHFPKVYLKHINHRHSRHFILDPSTHTHTQENSPSYEFRLPKVKVFWSMKGLTSFPQSLPETYQPQTLEAFHPRPFHPHPHPGKLTKLWIQTSKSQGFLKYEGSDIISPKSTWNISTTDTRHFILDPSTHTQENSPSYEFRLPKVKVFWSMKGLTSFPQSLPETYQPQTLEAFHPRPLHPQPHPGKLTKPWIQTSKSKSLKKDEGIFFKTLPPTPTPRNTHQAIPFNLREHIIHKRWKFFFLDLLTHTQEKQPTWKQLSNNTWDDHSVTSIPQPFPTMV